MLNFKKLQFWAETQQMVPLSVGITTVAVLISIGFVVLMLFRRYIFLLINDVLLGKDNKSNSKFNIIVLFI